MIKLRLPHNEWTPRPHQIGLWRYLQDGGKRAMAVWHRRAGKDEVLLHHTACSMLKRAGNYWTCLPEYNQARKAIWAALIPTPASAALTRRFLWSCAPLPTKARCSSAFTTARPTSVSAATPITVRSVHRAAGLTLSEYALSNPSAWAYFKPMIEENNGWAAFITTPRGRNHAFEM